MFPDADGTLTLQKYRYQTVSLEFLELGRSQFKFDHTTHACRQTPANLHVGTFKQPRGDRLVLPGVSRYAAQRPTGEPRPGRGTRVTNGWPTSPH